MANETQPTGDAEISARDWIGALLTIGVLIAAVVVLIAWLIGAFACSCTRPA